MHSCIISGRGNAFTTILGRELGWMVSDVVRCVMTSDDLVLEFEATRVCMKDGAFLKLGRSMRES